MTEKQILRRGMEIMLLLLSYCVRLDAQMREVDTNYIKNVPHPVWVDDGHLEIYRQNGNGRQRVIIEAATGKETLAPAEVIKRPAGITIRREDILYRDSLGKQVVITGIRDPLFSPDSAAIAFTRNNDLYIFDTAARREWRVTEDGGENVYNGYSSWVYNEEILGRSMRYRAFWWSPDSRRLAFMRFDDSQVPVYDLFDEAGVHGSHVKEHYPQPGDRNPAVRIAIADRSAQRVLWSELQAGNDGYFGTPYWRPDGGALWVQWMNRRQDSLRIAEMDVVTAGMRTVYTETQPTWIDLDLDQRVQFIPSRHMFLVLSDRSGWQQIYLYSMEGRFIRQLTSGDWAVEGIQYIDAKNGWIFFTAHKENSTRTDLYKVKLGGDGLQRLTFGAYTHEVALSPGGSYFTTRYSNYTTPAALALMDSNGKLIRLLGEGKGRKFEEYSAMARRSEILRVPTPDGFDLPVRIYWPARLDTTRKYPLMANIYGGPGSSFVRDGYTEGIDIRSDTGSDMINVMMDHRGSGQFGKKGENYLFHRLGEWEIRDYVTVIRWLERRYACIDTSRVGIRGFSYGGYITCLALTRAADVFKFGLAGGSVTDWRLYDAPYTERYMGMPSENEEGYRQASVMTYVNNYRGLLRLDQGTADDNVHVQNTLQLVSALEDAGKHFELMLYPGGRHGWLDLHRKYDHYYKEGAAFIQKYLLH